MGQRDYRRLSGLLTQIGGDPVNRQTEVAGDSAVMTVSLGNFEFSAPSRRFVEQFISVNSAAVAALFSLIEIQAPYPHGLWIMGIQQRSAGSTFALAQTGVTASITANQVAQGNGILAVDEISRRAVIIDGVGVDVNNTPVFPSTTVFAGTNALGPPPSTYTIPPLGASTPALMTMGSIWIEPGTFFSLVGTVVNTAIVADLWLRYLPFDLPR